MYTSFDYETACFKIKLQNKRIPKTTFPYKQFLFSILTDRTGGQNKGYY